MRIQKHPHCHTTYCVYERDGVLPKTVAQSRKTFFPHVSAHNRENCFRTRRLDPYGVRRCRGSPSARQTQARITTKQKKTKRYTQRDTKRTLGKAPNGKLLILLRRLFRALPHILHISQRHEHAVFEILIFRSQSFYFLSVSPGSGVHVFEHQSLRRECVILLWQEHGGIVAGA